MTGKFKKAEGIVTAVVDSVTFVSNDETCSRGSHNIAGWKRAEEDEATG